MNDVVVAHELSKRYGKTSALDRVSFHVPQGSIYGVLGPNGAGKTTMFDVLMNLQLPSAGGAIVLGSDSRALRGYLFESIGYVAETQKYPEWMRVGYLLDYLKPFYRTWDDARTSELLAQFRLPVERKLKELSRGMRMKALLTSVLAYRPKLLVLDEPFSGLDPLTRDELIEALLDGAPETSVLISSHDLAEIESFVTHVGYLSDGRLRFSEELPVLAARFREITVTVDRPSRPDLWPPDWLCPDTGASFVRFVDSRFDPVRTADEIRLRLPGAIHVETSAMTLRSIFLALARAEALTETSR